MYQNFCMIEKIALEKGYYVNVLGELYYKNRKCKQIKNKKGYYVFGIRYNKKIKKVLTHRLQAYQKYKNNIYISGIEVRHLDGNKNNNRWDNLIIGTHSENMLDIPKNIRIRKAINSSLNIVKYYNVEEIRKYHNDGHSYNEIMKHFNISSKGTIYYIIKKSKNIANTV